MQKRLDKLHDITGIEISDSHLKMGIDGLVMSWKLSDISARLASSSEIERKMFTISPAGYGIHWPLLDEDISIAII